MKRYKKFTGNLSDVTPFPCTRCGKGFQPFIRHYDTKPSSICKHCLIRSYRDYIKELERLKKEVREGIKEPANLQKWDAMNSQEKKITLFRFMEMGVIYWNIKGTKAVPLPHTLKTEAPC